jgi:hypothetical protein
MDSVSLSDHVLTGSNTVDCSLGFNDTLVRAADRIPDDNVNDSLYPDCFSDYYMPNITLVHDVSCSSISLSVCSSQSGSGARSVIDDLFVKPGCSNSTVVECVS